MVNKKGSKNKTSKNNDRRKKVEFMKRNRKENGNERLKQKHEDRNMDM